MTGLDELHEGYEPVHGFEHFHRVDDVAQAMLHPLRRRAYIEAVREPVSAKELSARLGVPLQRMSYHVRLLADADLLKVVRRTQRRGAMETHYRAVATLEFSDEAMNAASDETRAWFALAELRSLTEDLEHAVAEEDVGTDHDYLMSRAHFVVDDAGREKLHGVLKDFYRRLAALEEELRVEPGPDAHELNVILGLYRGERRAGRNGPAVTGLPDDMDTIPV